VLASLSTINFSYEQPDTLVLSGNLTGDKE
jgi:hypothetical protein